MFRDMLCSGLRASRTPLTCRVTATAARGGRVKLALLHTSLGSSAEHERTETTPKSNDKPEVERVSWVWNAYSDKESALLKKLLSEGKSCKEIAPQFPGRSITSLRNHGRGSGTYYWSQGEYELLSKGIRENLSDEEIKHQYLPLRSTLAIFEKRRRGHPQRDNIWLEAEDEALFKLREEGKITAQIRKLALPHRSESAIKKRVLQLIAEQKLMPYVGSNYGYTNEDVENFKKLHAEGFDNGQIAARLGRTVGSVTQKLRLLGMKHNPTKEKRLSNGPWSKAEEEQLTPFLRKVVAAKDMRQILPHRSEDAIRGRMAKLRGQLGIKLRDKGPAWTAEEIAQLRAFEEHRSVNQGSPGWREVARRLGRTLASIERKVGILRREAKRANQV